MGKRNEQGEELTSRDESMEAQAAQAANLLAGLSPQQMAALTAHVAQGQQQGQPLNPDMVKAVAAASLAGGGGVEAVAAGPAAPAAMDLSGPPPVGNLDSVMGGRPQPVGTGQEPGKGKGGGKGQGKGTSVTGLMVGRAEHKQDVIIGLMRNSISVDRRVSALENHCYQKWEIAMPCDPPLQDYAKKKAQEYHAFAVTKKGTGQPGMQKTSSFGDCSKH